jgi:hypothetical protein
MCNMPKATTGRRVYCRQHAKEMKAFIKSVAK